MTKRNKTQGGRYTAPNDRSKLVRQRLRQARAQHEQATRAAQADPGNHEKRTKAFALGATVKVLEGMLSDD